MATLLEHQAKELLTRYGIPTTVAQLATDAAAAVAYARDTGSPGAIKIASPEVHDLR
mgnify:CR=1 FL=1